MDVQAWMADQIPAVEQVLDRVLPTSTEEPERLSRAMRHLVFPGGKRLRPAFALAAAQAVGGGAEQALSVAAAVELIHVYSLIHDDLPCMDDDIERRGRPTVHVAFDEATAVLAGDALQSLAFSILLSEAPTPWAARIGAELADAVGARGLVGGQVDDLAAESVKPDLDGILSIHARKSAALIAVAISGGARLGGGSEAEVETMRCLGRDVGIAFQMTDDVLDAEDDEGCSLIPLLGAQGCRDRAEALLEGALSQIEDLGEPAGALRELCQWAVRRSL
ncbi:MAG: polyprenyl synthetase family protein [Myxococcota bacterium]|nr:polyprenyl synthetase family protein [Myxococcota bacterium]